MKRAFRWGGYSILLSIFSYQALAAIVGPVVPGQSLWCINKRIASEIDHIDTQIATCCATLNSKLDGIDSQLDFVESKVDALCHATMITGPTTITQEGTYCLGNTINGAITIAASNVNLDLNNRRVTQGITVNSSLDQVTIENGTVEGSANAILVNGGATNITIEDVTVKNAIRGINFQNVTDAVINNCEMVLNTTGIELDNSHNITIQNCVASRNRSAGYSFVSSTTNSVENCKALSTGAGNTDITNATVCGFVSLNGYGNIFEQCIANSTQALTTTDQNSLVAGFALRGTEGATKIINCEATNSTTSPTGVTVPYGIILESRFDSLVSVTSVNPDGGGTSDSLRSVSWSSDGRYLAVVGNIVGATGNDLFVYRFDRMTEGLVQVAAVNPDGGSVTDDMHTVQWSPDGTYVAVGGDIGDTTGNDLFVYKFDRTTETLTQVASVNPDDGSASEFVLSVNWSPDGRYLAVGGIVSGTTNKDLFVYKFDRVAETLTQVTAVNPDGGGTNDEIWTLQWSPNGIYLAAAGTVGGATNNDLFIYKFDRTTETLAEIISLNPDGGSTSDDMRALNWSPDGHYLAVGGAVGDTTGADLLIYKFDQSRETLTQVTSVNPDGGSTGDIVESINWSPDGKYLAVGGTIDGATGNDLLVYSFDRGTATLTPVASVNPDGGSTNETIFTVQWSPDGMYLAAAGSIGGTTNNDLFVYRAIQFPTRNVIMNNKVYDNSGARFPSGVGISGSSICNIIIGNTAYSNPINPLMVGSNYQFVTNVFNQRFGTAPSELQNISLDTCEPIATPDDTNLITKQILYKIAFPVTSQLDVITTTISVNDRLILSDIDACCTVLGSKIDKIIVNVSGIDQVVTHIDTVERELATCCAQLNSKLDNLTLLTSLNDRLILSDIDSCCALLNSKLDLVNTTVSINDRLILSDIDSCCAQLNSKLDTISRTISINDRLILSDIDTCCATLNSKLDNLTLLTSLNDRLILSDIDSCCALLNSKLDLINMTVSSNDRLILSDIDSCCGTLNSKLDNLTLLTSLNDRLILSDIDSCCALLNSKLDVLTRTVSLNDRLILSDIDSCCAMLNSKLDVIDSQLDVVESKVDALCHATMITGPSTITTAGSYCLGTTINGAITIAASNVNLDLNNRRVTQGITVNSGLDQVTIENGTVEGSANAILVNGGAQNITIQDVTVKNAIRGINFQGVTDGWITNCEMVLNTTGLELDNCHKITVKDCVAGDNIHAGFSLVSSTTNTFENCQALSTGIGNTDIINTTVCGFFSINGYGNIFERCIANSTQALTATDQNSIIAGFALRGTEGASKIINCEAANSTSSPNGVTVPYGIFLEARFDGLTTVTSVNVDGGGTGDQVFSVNWSPDGVYLAVGGLITGTTNNNILVYRFNRLTEGLVQVNSTATNTSAKATATIWSPNGRYLAVGYNMTAQSGNDLLIYSFDRVTESLTLVDSLNPSPSSAGGNQIVNNVGWRPDGRYLAVGVTSTSLSTSILFLYKFNPVTEKLSLITGFDPQTSGGSVQRVVWSPDGTYLAVGGTIGGASGNDLYLYRFDQSTETLALVDSVNPDSGSADDIINALAWSYDGKYLAAGGVITGTTNNDLFVYRFNKTTQTLTQVDSVNPDSGGTSDNVISVKWSADGKYLAVGGTISGTTNNDLFVYKFDRGTEKLTQVDSVNPDGGSTSDTVIAIDWSPDGNYMAVGGILGDTTGNDLFIYRAFRFPLDNVIKNNTVYDNSGGVGPVGVGIYGTSICNFIINNTAYSNPINPSIIGSNYQFVANVFNQLFEAAPSDFQNISLGSCEPIALHDDVALLVKQNINRSKNIESKIDIILSCYPIPLTSANVSSSGTLTISSAGCYCLSTDITADVTITASCVCLDLGGHCLNGTVTMSSADDIVVKNGFINAPAPTLSNAAVTINSTVNGAMVENIMITCNDTTISSFQGRTGITTSGNDVQILTCTIKAGSASSTASSGSGFAGGDGISVQNDANRTLIKDCVIVATGNGSSSTNSTGGRAGHGISLTGTAAFTEIINCIVFSTGNGGNGTTPANGGAGGHGVDIASTVIDSSVRNCTFRNTGSGGTGATAGTNGRAVNDAQVTAGNLSMIFSNFAHNIANSVKYNIQNTGLESGVLTPNPPTSTVINPLANVYAS